MTGKTKLKIILLGNQGVGKSSIIDQYINNKFDDNYNVVFRSFSRLSESISLLKMSQSTPKLIDYNSGTLQVNKDFVL